MTVGEAGDANEDVTQVVEVLATEALKWGWLIGRLAHFLQQGTVPLSVSTPPVTAPYSHPSASQCPFNLPCPYASFYHSHSHLVGPASTHPPSHQVLVFVSTKAADDELAKSLSAHTPHRVEAIHGDRTQAHSRSRYHGRYGRAAADAAGILQEMPLEMPLEMPQETVDGPSSAPLQT